MNIAPLRKTILKESAIFTVLLLALSGAVFYLDSLYGEYEQQSRSALAQANKLLAEKQDADTRFTTVKDGLGMFEESQRRAQNPGLFIDSQAIRDLFNLYQPQFFLKKLAVEMQPIVDVDDPKFVRKHFIANRAGIKVVIEAMSDEDVYKLIGGIQKELPGFVKITGLTLLKKEELSKEILARVRKEGPYPLVSAELMFDWYGLKSTDPNSPLNKYVPKKTESPPP